MKWKMLLRIHSSFIALHLKIRTFCVRCHIYAVAHMSQTKMFYQTVWADANRTSCDLLSFSAPHWLHIALFTLLPTFFLRPRP